MPTKIALVTGGSRGLGKDMALSLAKKGINVVLTYNTNQDAAKAVVADIEQMGQQAAAVPLDMGNIGSLSDFMEQLRTTLQTHWQTETFDFLIHNAGVGATIPIAEVTEDAFDRLLNIHFKGVYFLTQQAMPHLNDNGAVIFISTGTTRVCVPGYSVYSSLKSAVETFTKYVAKEYGSRGIRANVVAPGPRRNGLQQRRHPQQSANESLSIHPKSLGSRRSSRRHWQCGRLSLHRRCQMD